MVAPVLHADLRGAAQVEAMFRADCGAVKRDANFHSAEPLGGHHARHARTGVSGAFADFCRRTAFERAAIIAGLGTMAIEAAEQQRERQEQICGGQKNEGASCKFSAIGHKRP
jgi:hypothetical protein